MTFIRSLFSRFKWHILIVGLSVYAYYNLDAADVASYFSTTNRSPVMRSEDTVKRKQVDIENKILKEGKKVVAEVCSPNTNFCYLITDTASKIDNSLIVRRSMILKNNSRYAFTIAELETPEELTWSNFNTKYWPVNKVVMVSRYVKVMIAASFFTEALTLDPMGSQNVLIIGLGGGVASNFLSVLDWLNIYTTAVELDPFVADVAREWYQHDDDEKTRIVIDDGAEFVARTAKEGKKKYHSIMLDACYNDNRPTLCPVSQFEDPKIIQNMADMLEAKGVLIVYIICTKDTVPTEVRLLKLYQEYFPSCFLLKYLPERQMLICSKKPNWTWEEQKPRFKKNLETVDDTFELKIAKFFENH